MKVLYPDGHLREYPLGSSFVGEQITAIQFDAQNLGQLIWNLNNYPDETMDYLNRLATAMRPETTE